MKTMFTKIKSILLNRGPEPEHKPPPQPVRFSIEPEEEEPPAPVGEWRRLPNGDRVRTIYCGSKPGTGSEMLEDEPKAPRRTRKVISFNGPFDDHQLP